MEEFARLLGRDVITQGHVLLDGCCTRLDQVLAESAAAATQELGKDPNERIVSYCLQGKTPARSFGNVRMSQLVDWELGNPKLRVPEPIQLADAVILVGGFRNPPGGKGGTGKTGRMALDSGKAVFPLGSLRPPR